MAIRLTEPFFRREYGRLVAMLAHGVGVQHLAAVEDAVQSALETALTVWPRDGEPASPSAWLTTVAYRRLIQVLRQDRGRARIVAGLAVTDEDAGAAPARFAGEVDDLLRLLFVCCDDAIPPASCLVLALKTLCGFSTTEIALRLFTSRANVQKRLDRGREQLRARGPALLDEHVVTRGRLPGVHAVLYLLFNEGYLSAREDEAIRRELCDEALRLTTLLAEHPVGAVPASFALLALMHLHRARLAARAGAGGLVLLAEQDRAAWDTADIAEGMVWLARSASGDALSRYHAEAGIAAAHCLAPSFAATPWDQIADLYAMLEALAPSPLHRLNRAVAIAESRGAAAGLAVLAGPAPPALASSYLWHAVLADLHGRAGHLTVAARHRARALRAAPTRAIRALLRRRLGD